MSMSVDFDVVDGASIRSTPTSIEIVRPALVYDIPLDCSVGMTDPAVLLKAMTILPGRYAQHPSDPYALLEDYGIHSIRSTTAVMVAMSYKRNLTSGPAGQPVNWIKNLTTQNFVSETYGTADGSEALLVYFQPGLGDGTSDDPPGTPHQERIGKARRVRTYKVMTVTGRMRYSDWLTLAPGLELAEERINKDSWGSSTRGQWLYLGPKVQVPIPTYDQTYAQMFATIELTFLKDKLGHFPLIAYFNERREHPKGCIPEGTLRGLGLPPANGVIARNGLTIASIYKETTFSDKFTFTP